MPTARLTRREAVLLGGSAVTASVTGCQELIGSEQPDVDLHLVNYTDEPQPIQVDVLRTDKREESTAQVFTRTLTVPAPGPEETAGSMRRENILPPRPYILYVFPKFGRRHRHFHFYPGSTDSANVFDVRLYREADSDIVYPRFFM